MNGYLPSRHPAERLVHLTVASVLEQSAEAPPQALALLEAVVAEVFMGDPSGWSVESVERLLRDPAWLGRAASRPGIDADAPCAAAVREMVVNYRHRQRARFGCGSPTPLWPWLEIRIAR